MIKNLIVFHGSNLNINNQIKEFENILSKQTDKSFSICFLKSSPNLKDELIISAKEHFSEINILPLFLLPGNHLSYEIPNIVKEFNKTFPDIAVNINNYLASDNIFIKYIANKLK